jgi:hypothetical protein
MGKTTTKSSRRKKRAPVQLEKKTLPQLRRKLWAVMSQAIRDQWRLKDGSTECYTCRTKIPAGGKVDCGHGWPKRKYGGTYYDHRNIRPQCTSCNLAGQGEQWAFFNRLVEEIGHAEFEEMSSWRHDKRPTRKEWYIREIKKWTAAH